MNAAVVTLLRIGLGAIAVGAVLAQVAVPGIASEIGGQFPEVAHLVTLYSVLAILAIACFEVILLAAWRLLRMVGRDRIFTDTAVKWVNVVAIAAACAGSLCVFAWVHVILIEGTGGPGALFGLAALALVGFTLALVVTVVRGVLKMAVENRHELAGVI